MDTKRLFQTFESFVNKNKNTTTGTANVFLVETEHAEDLNEIQINV